MKISLCMIVKNEEADLADCLQSAAGCADEMIIVDTGSTDRTREIALQFGARVIDYKWRDHFGEARNCALDAATGDWILILDADERLEKDGAAKIRNAIQQKSASSFRLEIVSDVGRASGQKSILVRLYRRDASIRYIRRIHESVNESIVAWNRKMQQKTFDLDVTIAHFGYIPSRFEQLGKRARNLHLHELAVADDPADAYAWYRFGDELRAVDKKKAAEVLRHAWKLLANMPVPARRMHLYAPEVAVILAYLALEDGNAEAAKDILKKGDADFGRTPNGIYVEALANAKLQNWSGALANFETLRKLDGKRFEAPVQAGITNILACLGAAGACERLANDSESERWLCEAIQIDPNNSQAAIALAKLYHRTGKREQARRELDLYIQRKPGDGAAWVLSGEFAMAEGAFSAAEKRFAVAASAPNAPDWVREKLSEVRKLIC
ncbi:MAG: glycosyltransferase [Planctomycetota bacterium]